jgi:rsbT co-antagonist protein RsbR
VLTRKSAGRMSQLFQERGDQIFKRWTEMIVQAASGRLTDAEVRAEASEILAALVEALRAGRELELGGPAGAELRAVLAELSSNRARRGYSPTETAKAVFLLKDALTDSVGSADPELLADVHEFSRFVDEMGLFTFETYAQTREELIIEQNQQLLELSTPVIKLWEGVLAIPLVGTLDSARTQIVMEKLLQTLVDTGSGYAIIDITGVPAVDTQVAQHILKTVMAARLMGAECVISGIRPQIAQTVVTLGIEFGDIVTKASLADALRYALRGSGTDPRRARPEQ